MPVPPPHAPPHTPLPHTQFISCISFAPPFKYFIFTNTLHVFLVLAVFVKPDGTCDRLYTRAVDTSRPDHTICKAYVEYVVKIRKACGEN